MYPTAAMPTRRPTRRPPVPAARPAPAPIPPTAGKKDIHKTVIFPADSGLADAVERVRQQTRGSFSAAAVTLIEAGLRVQGAGLEADTVAVSALPPWIRSGVLEAARLTGLSPASVLVDLIGRNLTDYLARARGLPDAMAHLLSAGLPPPAEAPK